MDGWVRVGGVDVVAPLFGPKAGRSSNTCEIGWVSNRDDARMRE